MKFRCERDVLADALSSAGRAATNRTGTLPVLAGIRMQVAGDTLTVTGTDLELTIQLTVEVGGERDGAAVVPARLVGDIVKALPAGEVEIDDFAICSTVVKCYLATTRAPLTNIDIKQRLQN